MIQMRLIQSILGGYTYELEKAVSGCDTVLDIGCGNNSPIQSFSRKLYSVGVDGFPQSIVESKEKRIHNDYVILDLLKIGQFFKADSFDCVIALDVIEHFEKNDGLKLIAAMEKIARKKIIIFTPNGYLPQGIHFDNPLQIHRSGWNYDEMKKFGYTVTGINGWKPLRGDCAEVKFQPKFLWRKLSTLTQFFVKNHPKHAFQLLCVKTKVKK